MRKNQWITVGIGLLLIIGIYLFANRVPPSSKAPVNSQQHQSGDISIDTILVHAKENLTSSQVTWLGSLEQSVVRGDVKGQQMNVYHQLAHFWKDSARLFEPYAWYEAEAARLENSEKSLTFAAHLFLENLQGEKNPQLLKWKALQAKDLFERSIKLNPNNDSSQVGLGATYVFGNISENPMEGIQRIVKVTERDSNNVFAHWVLGHGSVLSGQYDKAIVRFEKVLKVQPSNLEAMLMLAEVYERKGDKQQAVVWYRRAMEFAGEGELKAELEKRIQQLNTTR